jgi:hypothetical protein
MRDPNDRRRRLRYLGNGQWREVQSPCDIFEHKPGSPEYFKTQRRMRRAFDEMAHALELKKDKQGKYTL